MTPNERELEQQRMIWEYLATYVAGDKMAHEPGPAVVAGFKPKERGPRDPAPVKNFHRVFGKRKLAFAELKDQMKETA